MISNSVFVTLFLNFLLIAEMNVRRVFTSALLPPHPVITNYMTGPEQSCILPHYNLGLGSTNLDQIVCFNLLIYFLIFLLHEVGLGCLKKGLVIINQSTMIICMEKQVVLLKSQALKT